MIVSSDDRRLAFFDIFDTPGQVNIVHLHPGSICAWHRHQKQTDYYFCVSGTVKVGIFDGNWDGRFYVLDPRTPTVLTVPPGMWHGYKALGPATLLQYLDQKYSPDDEERHPANPADWETHPK